MALYANREAQPAGAHDALSGNVVLSPAPAE
jgi:hypothetical protein